MASSPGFGLAIAALVLAACATATRPDPPGSPGPGEPTLAEVRTVENLVFSAAWAMSGQTVPPSFYGIPYDNMVDDPATAPDEAHMFMPHFDRHVWLYRDNPNGVFSPFNPALTCEHHTGARTHPGM